MRGRWDETEVLFRDDRKELLGLVGPIHPKTICTVHYLGQIETGTWRSATRVATAAASLARTPASPWRKPQWTQSR